MKRRSISAHWVGFLVATFGVLFATASCSFEHYQYTPLAVQANCGGEAGPPCDINFESTGGSSSNHCVEDAGTHCDNPNASSGGAPGATGGASSSICPGDAGTICEPACNAMVAMDGGYPSSLVTHWTFDGDGGSWLESDLGEHTLTLSPGAQDTDTRYSKTRINGKGNSLYLHGSQFAQYTGSNTDPLFAGSQPAKESPTETGFTVSAYVSMESLESDDAGTQTTHVMPIVSTMTGDSCGYQLDLRWNDGDANAKLAFSYGFHAPSDAGESCQINKLEYTITLSAFSALGGWGMGRWHHVAGAYVKTPGDDTATLKLYWDGTRVANDGVQHSEAAPPIYYTDYKLYVGTNGDNTQKFKGYIDEIAIFNQPLSDGELAQFLTQSSSRPGPNQCRWTTTEYWDKYAPDASTASWESDSNPETSHVVVDDNNFGAGGLNALIAPAKDLRLHSKMYLDATLQKDRAFAIQINNGANFCQWLILGVGGRHTYPIDLRRPGACYTTGCEFKPDKIDLISINTEWIVSSLANPTPDNPARSTGPVEIAVHSVSFEASTNPAIDWSNYGGAIGPNGWCWRPSSYDLVSGTEWVSSPSVGSVSANLMGLPQSSTRLAADFSNDPYRLPSNACVLIDASTNFDSNQTGQFLSFSISDRVGSWGSWDIILPSPGSPSVCMMHLTGGVRYYSSTGHSPPYDAFPDSLDLDHITNLGIEKPFAYDTTTKGPVEVTIRGITIYPDDGKNCATYGTFASCRPQ